MSVWRYAPGPLPRVVGWAALGLLAAFVLAGAVPRSADRPLVALVAGLAAVAGTAVATVVPHRSVLGGAVVAGAAVTVLGNGSSAIVSWFGLCILAAWCVMSLPLATALGYGIAAIVVLACELIFAQPDPGWFAWIGGTCFSVGGAYAGMRQRQLLMELRVAQADLATRAQAEERGRIARELHDVIAHSLTVSLLHVTSARLAVEDAPGEARDALVEAERLGRRSLDEVRQVVGLLREQDSAAVAPLPGGPDIPALVESFRRAGSEVRDDIDGDTASLPETTGLAAYRIVQESLTNAAKHAPRSPVSLRMHIAPTAVRIEVHSAGPPGTGAGLGLAGMRERASALGGSCEAAPGGGGGGWLVRADLPIVRSAPPA